MAGEENLFQQAGIELRIVPLWYDVPHDFFSETTSRKLFSSFLLSHNKNTD